MPGDGPREDGPESLGDDEGKPTAGCHDVADSTQRGARIVHDLEGAVQTRQVNEGARKHGSQVLGIALDCGDRCGHSGLAGASTQGRQGIWAGVDDDDVMTGLRQRDGEATGAAAEVENAQRAAELGGPLFGDTRDRCPDRGCSQPGLDAAAWSAALLRHGNHPSRSRLGPERPPSAMQARGMLRVDARHTARFAELSGACSAGR